MYLIYSAEYAVFLYIILCLYMLLMFYTLY